MDQKNTTNEIGNQLHSQPNEPVSYQTVHSYFNVNVENYSNSSVYIDNNEKTQQPTLKKHKSKHHS